jgi:16S rRNA processing protein RimM
VVVRPHGVRGELRLFLHNPESRLLEEVAQVYVAGVPRRLLSARPVAGAYLVRLEGVDDRDEAERLRGARVAVARSDIRLEEGEYLLADLVGCRAVLPDGQSWGQVVAIELGAQDRLVIQDGDVERLLPCVDEFLGAFDPQARTLEVTPPADWPEYRLRRDEE